MTDRLPPHDRPEVHAILGPTNTGKTHQAIERMLQHRSGVIGLPLRLLAREVYDRVAARRGQGAVALITGEEKIAPASARYRVCTTEAMSSLPGADFVAVDEIQVAADPERGHVFTDRLLRARGYRETLFLGSASMANRIRQLVPECRVTGRERFSTLTYGGRMRIETLPPRAAIVAFSAADVYEIASLVRRRRGGAAVVLGVLSPRTRNAQVGLFQSGEVDTIVATDAIGMGLNLDIDVVAFTRLSKFDGERSRRLRPEEIGQIAGRAGRHRRPGSFAVVDWEEDLEPVVARAVEEQRFPPIPFLRWRNPDLDFSSVPALLESLRVRPQGPGLARPREGSDLRALQILANDTGILRRAEGAESVKLLWNACRIPDYPGIAAERHAALVREIFFALASPRAFLTDDWMASAIARINTRTEDIDALAVSLEHARTCQYVANQADWLPDPSHWRERTRRVEDEISDSLHRRLVDLFVDVRASRIARLARQGRKPVANVEGNGAVAVEGAVIGWLDGFLFRTEKHAGNPPTEAETRAASAVAQAALSDRIQSFLSADGSEVSANLQNLCWRSETVATLSRSDDPLKPQVRAIVAEFATAEDRDRVQNRLQNHFDAMLRRDLGPLFALRDDERLTPAARGIAYRIAEAFGLLPRADAAAEIRALPQEERKLLRAHGVRFGSRYVFVPALLKPAPTRLRLSIWSIFAGPGPLPDPPAPGLVNVPADPDCPNAYLRMCGFHRCGGRAVRIDMMERLVDLIRDAEAGNEWFPGTLDMLSITGSSAEDLREIMDGLGYEAEPLSETQEPDATDSVASDAGSALKTHTGSAPVGTEPAPVGTEPAPVGTEPAPVGTEPAPGGTEPAPVGTEPALAETGPADAAPLPGPGRPTSAAEDAPAIAVDGDVFPEGHTASSGDAADSPTQETATAASGETGETGPAHLAAGYRYRRKPRLDRGRNRRPRKPATGGQRARKRGTSKPGSQPGKPKQGKAASRKDAARRKPDDPGTPGFDPNSPFAVLANLKFDRNEKTSGD